MRPKLIDVLGRKPRGRREQPVQVGRIISRDFAKTSAAVAAEGQDEASLVLSDAPFSVQWSKVLQPSSQGLGVAPAFTMDEPVLKVLDGPTEGVGVVHSEPPQQHQRGRSVCARRSCAPFPA